MSLQFHMISSLLKISCEVEARLLYIKGFKSPYKGPTPNQDIMSNRIINDKEKTKQTIAPIYAYNETSTLNLKN